MPPSGSWPAAGPAARAAATMAANDRGLLTFVLPFRTDGGEASLISLPRPPTEGARPGLWLGMPRPPRRNFALLLLAGAGLAAGGAPAQEPPPLPVLKEHRYRMSAAIRPF